VTIIDKLLLQSIEVFVRYTDFGVLVRIGDFESRVTGSLFHSLILGLYSLSRSGFYLGVTFWETAMSAQMGVALMNKAVDCGVDIIRLPGKLAANKTPADYPKDPRVKPILDRVFGENAFPDWCYSTTRGNAFDKALEGMSVYMLKQKPMHVSVDLIEDMLYDLIGSLPYGDDGVQIEVDVPSPFLPGMYEPNESAVGYTFDSALPVPGSKIDTYYSVLVPGLKKLKEESAKGVAEPLPYRTITKNEVVKKEKKSRSIQVSAYVSHVVGHNVVLPVLETAVTTWDGMYTKLPMTCGGTLRVVYDMLIKYRMITGKVLSLEDVEFVEADKKNWEGRADPVSGMLLWVLYGLMLPRDVLDDVLMRNCLRWFWRDYLRPLFPLQGNAFYTRFGAVPSGSPLTSVGNTHRHKFVRRAFGSFVRLHGYKSDGCEICKEVGEWVADPIDLEVELHCCAIMGDDFLGLKTPLSLLCAKFCDFAFGMETEFEVKKASDKPEFLRTSFAGGTIWRDFDRVFAKMYHGDADLKGLAESCISLSYLSAGQPEVHARLKEIFGLCSAAMSRTDAYSIEDYKTGEVFNMPVGVFPSYNVVCDFQRYGPKEERHHTQEILLGKRNHVNFGFLKRVSARY
jgi:hypothetical protein